MARCMELTRIHPLARCCFNHESCLCFASGLRPHGTSHMEHFPSVESCPLSLLCIKVFKLSLIPVPCQIGASGYQVSERNGAHGFTIQV